MGRGYLKVATENKKSVYISSDNIEILEKLKEKSKKKSLSYWLNKVLDEYRSCKRFLIKGKEGYIPVKISCKKELADLLEQLGENFDTSAVVQLVNQRLLEEFNNQAREYRRKYPDRLYSGDNYLDKLAEKCKKFLISKR